MGWGLRGGVVEKGCSYCCYGKVEEGFKIGDSLFVGVEVGEGGVGEYCLGDEERGGGELEEGGG